MKKPRARTWRAWAVVSNELGNEGVTPFVLADPEGRVTALAIYDLKRQAFRCQRSKENPWLDSRVIRVEIREVRAPRKKARRK